MRVASFLAAAAVLLTLPTSPVLAHDDAYLAVQKAPNGGQLRMAGPYHYELVVDGDGAGSAERAIVVYVTDHAGAPVSTQGAQGVAHVLVGKERNTVPLVSDGANRMKGVGRSAWASDAKVVVSITMAGAPPAQARFAADAVPATGSGAASHAGAGRGH